MYRDKDKHGIITRDYTGNASLTQVIVETNDVTEAEFDEGFWHIYSIKALHNARSLFTLPRYLHLSGRMPHHKLMMAFSDYLKSRMDHSFARFVTDSIEHGYYVETENYPAAYLRVLQTERHEFAELLSDFAKVQSWWGDETARFLLELDQLIRPRIYKNAPDDISGTKFEFITANWSDDDANILDVTIPVKFLKILDKLNVLKAPQEPGAARHAIRVIHPKMDTKFAETIDEEDTAVYCTLKITNMASVVPELQDAGPVRSRGVIGRLLERVGAR